jgi:hypothetical protein
MLKRSCQLLPYFQLMFWMTGSSSGFKGILPQFMADWSIGNWTYLGKYEAQSRETTGSKDRTGSDSVYEVHPSTTSGNELASSRKELPATRSEITPGRDSENTAVSTWKDHMVRLAYFHVIDSAIHVIWLRFFYKWDGGAPYTCYANNSEILTALLVIEVVVWVVLRMRMRTMSKEYSAHELSLVQCSLRLGYGPSEFCCKVCSCGTDGHWVVSRERVSLWSSQLLKPEGALSSLIFL